jgi:uncharacterized protein YegL
MQFSSRRLPVYLMLDCSGSMAGEPVEACRQGLKALLSDLRGDPQALETAHLSVITFSNGAQQVCPLTEVMTFVEPTLNASGSTDLGAALEVLEKCVDSEVRKTTPKQKGDWKPLVFVMTDGQPTDNWEPVADRVKARRMNIVACAAGPGADGAMLKRLTENVVQLSGLEPDQLKAFFKWMSASVKTTSVGVGEVPPPPAGIVIVP